VRAVLFDMQNRIPVWQSCVGGSVRRRGCCFRQLRTMGRVAGPGQGGKLTVIEWSCPVQSVMAQTEGWAFRLCAVDQVMIICILFFEINLSTALWIGIIVGLGYTLFVRAMYRQQIAAYALEQQRMQAIFAHPLQQQQQQQQPQLPHLAVV
jgi:hypothetical protein